jgi:hypothetical protein
MPKKSHSIASRQAASSKERKRKKKSLGSSRHSMPAGATPDTSAELTAETPDIPSTMATPEPQITSKVNSKVTRPAPAVQQETPGYKYVIADLRKISLIAGATIIILIVLVFVLG